MATKPEATRNYLFTDGTLKQNADTVLNLVNRDISEFSKRGVTPAVITAFKGLITVFDDTATDEELLGSQMQSTAKKDEEAEKLRVLLRTIRTMAQNVWGTTHVIYETFAFTGMDAFTDNELHRTAKRIHRVATSRLADLAPEGLTAAVLTKLSAQITVFDNAIDAKIDAENNRDLTTQDRIVKGNALYKEMMRLCNTGKDIYESTDQAKYNDYVIYGAGSPSALEAPPTA